MATSCREGRHHFMSVECRESITTPLHEPLLWPSSPDQGKGRDRYDECHSYPHPPDHSDPADAPLASARGQQGLSVWKHSPGLQPTPKEQIKQRKSVIMARNSKQTGRKAARAASSVLRDGRTSKASKTAAASALAQTPRSRKR